MTPLECKDRVEILSEGEKFHILKNHVKPTETHTFPSTYLHGCYRSFKPAMIASYPWAIYSPHLDGVFCIHCSLFCNTRENKGYLVNKPFTQWHKISAKLEDHTKAKYHQDSNDISQAFSKKLLKPETTLPYRVNAEKQLRITENRNILKMISKVILFCGRQNIALRGDIEDLNDTSKNPGNFLALLKILAESDDLLKRHLENPRAKNSTYLSPRIQNELIFVIGELILKTIIEKVQKAKFYSIMADEVESHNREVLPLCIRYVDENKVTREDFLSFIMLERITGEYIANKILSNLRDMNLEVSDMRGQAYDGAANMSSETVGLQRRIRDQAPLATYTHCCGHILNLVIVHSCKLTAIRNVIDKMKAVCLFFNNSPKREGLLKAIITNDVEDSSKRKPLLNLCVTRWAARHEAYQHFYQAFSYMVKAFEFIAHSLHQDGLETYQGRWDNDTKRDASGLLQCITSYDFIINFIILYMTLAQLDGISKGLQETALDVLGAYEMVIYKLNMTLPIGQK